MPTIISNTSPLIGLAKINLLHILKELWSEIIIPEAVYHEAAIAGEGKAGAELVKQACRDWIHLQPVKNRQEADALQAVLDPGEAEVIVLGQELGADLLLLDNREPRLFARTVNLNVIGTVGVIMLAADKGFVSDPLQEIHRLRASGFWVSDAVLEQLAAGRPKQ